MAEVLHLPAVAEAELVPPSRPYPGLRPFEAHEAGIFFGRERHLNRLLEILQREQFLAVIGPSGSGKSSLVRAGLLPALPLGALGTGPDWRIAVMRPGKRPLRNLATELLKPGVLGGLLHGEGPPGEAVEATEATGITLVEAELQRGHHALADLVRRTLALGGDRGDNLLILVDQFEEIFTYAEAGDRQADESEAFVNLLLTASRASELRVFVTITMRTDFLGHCVRFQDLPEAINRAQYLIPRLTRDEIRRAIVGPAQAYGGEIEASLVEELINAVQGNPDQLPLLQHAIARMWEIAVAIDAERPTIGGDELVRVGGIDGALSQHGEELLGKLSPRERLDAQWLFRALTLERTGDGGGQRVRRPQTLAKIAEWSGRPWRAFVPVVRRFSDPTANFLTYVGQPDEPADGAGTVIDLSHEALMRQWATLAGWITAEADAAREYRRLCERMVDEDKKRGALLTGADLLRAVAWTVAGLRQADQPPEDSLGAPTPAWAQRYDDKDRPQFEAVRHFVRKSRTRERLRTWSLRGLAAALVVASVGVGGFAYSAYREGLTSQATSYWSDLRVDGVSDPLSEFGAYRAHDLALAAPAVRNRFGQMASDQARLLPAFVAGSGLVARATVGLDDDLRRHLVSHLTSAPPPSDARRIARTVLMAQLGEAGWDDWRAAFVAPAEASQLSILAAQFGTALNQAPSDTRRQWLEGLVAMALDPTLPPDTQASVSNAMRHAVRTVPDAERKARVDWLYGLATRTDEALAGRILGTGLVELAGRLATEDLRVLGARWASDAARATGAGAGALPRLGALMVERLPTTALRIWLPAAGGPLLASAQDSPLLDMQLAVLDRLDDLPEAAERLVDAVAAADGATLQRWEPWLERLLTVPLATRLDRQIDLLPRALAAGVKVSDLTELVMKAGVAKVRERERSWAARALQATGNERAALQKAAAALASARENASMVPSEFGGAPLPIATPRPAPAAPGGVGTTLAAIFATVDPDELRTLGGTLVEAVQRQAPAAAEALFERLLADLLRSDDVDQVQALGRGLTAAVKAAPPSLQRRMLVRGEAVMRQPLLSEDKLSSLALAIAPARASLPSDEVLARARVVLDELARLAEALPRSEAGARRSNRAVNLQGPAAELVSIGHTLAAGDPGTRDQWLAALLRAGAGKGPGHREALDAALASAIGRGPATAGDAGLFAEVLARVARANEGAGARPSGFRRPGRPGWSPDDEGDGFGDPAAPVSGCGTNADTSSELRCAALHLAGLLPDAARQVAVQAALKQPLGDVRMKSELLVRLVKGRDPALRLRMLGAMVEALSTGSPGPERAAVRSASLRLLGAETAEARAQIADKVVRDLLRSGPGEGQRAQQLALLLGGLLKGDAPGKAAGQALMPDRALARLLVEACKIPYVDRAVVAAALRRVEPSAPPADAGLWALLRWAVGEYGVDVRLPPAAPA